MKSQLQYSHERIIICFITLCFVPSTYLYRFSFYAFIYDVLRYFLTALGVFLNINLKEKRNTPTLTRFIIAISGYYLWIIITTYLNHNSQMCMNGIKTCCISLGFVLLILYYSQKNYLTTLFGIKDALCILALINLITVVLFPSGLYIFQTGLSRSTNEAYFLGHRNNAIEVLIPYMGISLLLSHINNKKMDRSSVLSIAISFFTVVLTKSANAIVCVLIFGLFAVVLYNRQHFKIWNSYYFLIAAVVSTMGLVVFKLQYLFEYLIVNVFHKSMTLSNRSSIWDRSINCISHSPLLGYGLEKAEVKFYKIGAVNSCHNYFLDVLYYGGVILLILFVIVTMLTINSINRIGDKKTADIFTCIMCSYFILWIATPIHRDSLVWMFIIWLLAMINFENKKNCEGEKSNDYRLHYRRI